MANRAPKESSVLPSEEENCNNTGKQGGNADEKHS